MKSWKLGDLVRASSKNWTTELIRANSWMYFSEGVASDSKNGCQSEKYQAIVMSGENLPGSLREFIFTLSRLETRSSKDS